MLKEIRGHCVALLQARKGVTAMEYGLIAAVTAVAIVGGLTIIGPRLTAVFTTIGNALPA